MKKNKLLFAVPIILTLTSCSVSNSLTPYRNKGYDNYQNTLLYNAQLMIFDNLANRVISIAVEPGKNWFNLKEIEDTYFEGNIQTYYQYHTLNDAVRVYNRFNPTYISFSEINQAKMESLFNGSGSASKDERIGFYWTPKEYSVAYTSIPSGLSESDLPKSYTYGGNEILLPTSIANKSVVWVDIDGSEYVSLPIKAPKNLVLTPKYANYRCKVNYTNIAGLANPNPSDYCYLEDGNVMLLDPNVPTGVTFMGWYNESTNEKVQRLTNELTLSSNTEITLRAKFSTSENHSFYFYDGAKLLNTVSYNYDNRLEVLKNNLPSIDGFKTSWDVESIYEYEDYDIHLLKEELTAFVYLYSNDGRYLTSFSVRQGKNLKELSTRYMGATYFYDFAPKGESDKANIKNNAIYGDLSLTCKTGVVSFIYNYIDYLEIANHPDKAYILANDIDFKEASLKPINKFTGVLDGNGHKFTNFRLNNRLNEATFALIKDNSGVITNLTLEDFSGQSRMSYDENITLNHGLLCGVNNGIVSNINITSKHSFTMGIRQTSYKYRANTNNGLISGVNNGIIKDINVSSVSLQFNHVVGYGTPNMGGFLNYWGEIFAYSGLICGTNNGTISNIAQGEDTSITNVYSSVLNYENPVAHVRLYIYLGGTVGVNNGVVNNVTSATSIYQDDAAQLLNDIDDVDSYLYFGGIIGSNSGSLDRSSSSSIITVKEVHEYNYIAGLVAYNQGEMNHLFTNSEIKPYTYRSSSAGAVGLNTGYVAATVSSSKLSAYGYVGGLTGFVHTNKNGGGVKNCYSNTTIDYSHYESETTYPSAFGFVNDNYENSSVTNCFSSTTFISKGNVKRGYYFAGEYSHGTFLNNYVDMDAPNDIENMIAVDGYTQSNYSQLTNIEFLTNKATLYFLPQDWIFTSGYFPTVKL